jgi:hypothetical protein
MKKWSTQLDLNSKSPMSVSSVLPALLCIWGVAAAALPLAPGPTIRLQLAEPLDSTPLLLEAEEAEPGARLYLPFKALAVATRADGAPMLSVSGRGGALAASATVRLSHAWVQLAAALRTYKARHQLPSVELLEPAILEGWAQLTLRLKDGTRLPIGEPVEQVLAGADVVVGGILIGAQAQTALEALARGEGVLEAVSIYEIAAKEAAAGARVELVAGAGVALNGYCATHPRSFSFQLRGAARQGCLEGMLVTPVPPPRTRQQVCALVPDYCSGVGVGGSSGDGLDEFCQMFPDDPQCIDRPGPVDVEGTR